MTSEELAELNARTEKKHRIWWDFKDAIELGFDEGYESMEEIEQYVQDHPEIEICTCDDSSFAGSDLVFVPHPDMGISVVYVPQLSGGSAQFFLYPGHLNNLIDTLTKMRDKYFPQESETK